MTKKIGQVVANAEKKESCIIYFNHLKTADSQVRDNIVDQYKIADYTNNHITLREMLIHTSYI